MVRTLFVTRKFPPSVGGMQTLSADTWAALTCSRVGQLLIAHGRSNVLLPAWLPYAVGRTLITLLRRKVDVVLAGDALVFAALAPLLRLLPVRRVVLVHGKDVLWHNKLYRATVIPQLRHAQQVLAVSAATAAAARSAGVPADRIDVIRPGIPVPNCGGQSPVEAGAALRRRYGLSDSDAVVVLLGRLVRRKGAAWFCASVLTKLDPGTVVLVAGDGDDAPAVRRAAAASSLESAARVRILGAVNDADLELLLRGADLFAQPNIAVPGDMEGFGLVTVEAAMHGALVLAADLEGLRDAVIDGRTGILLPPADAERWAVTINSLLSDRTALRARAAAYSLTCRQEFSVEAMGAQLLRILDGRGGPEALSTTPFSNTRSLSPECAVGHRQRD